MKSIQVNVRLALLCALIVVFFSCKKDKVAEDTSPKFNYSVFTDVRDGKTYKYIKIGAQYWMAQNLAYKTLSGSWNSWDSDIEGAKYGRLYTWESAKQAVPAGWHLPSDAEWKQLEMTLGMSQSQADGINLRGTDEGTKLKATSGWGDEVWGTDEVGFKALPGGLRSNSGNYFVNGWYGYWWTASESDNTNAWMRYIIYYNSEVNRNLSFKEDALSVRCVKDIQSE